MENALKKIKLEKKENCDIFLVFNNFLTKVFVRVQHENIKVNIGEHKEYFGRYCETDSTLVDLSETPSIKQEKIKTLLRVFQKDKISVTSFSSTKVSYLFQIIQKIIDKIKIILSINKLVISAYFRNVDVEKYKVLKNFIINKSSEFKTVFFYPFGGFTRYNVRFPKDKQQINIMNTCSEVISPNTEIDIKYEYYSYRGEYLLFRKTLFCLCSYKALELTYVAYISNLDSRAFCSFVLKIVATGLVKRLRKFQIIYPLNTKAEFYLTNKLLWNVGTNFEDFDYFITPFKANKIFEKHFLWLLNKKKNNN
eukprot:snap_masked-scaffold_17-processed-gene-5.21-mRNA-1 protein AED:1.00 eAED:1.00 QI:0/-1/0/0/-1/1/1/0/308